jgi:protein involved in polysaccharide export with SLBB domain
MNPQPVAGREGVGRPDRAGPGLVEQAGAVGRTQAAAEGESGGGDRLRVIVFGQDNLSNIYTVDGAGRIIMPLIGVASRPVR